MGLIVRGKKKILSYKFCRTLEEADGRKTYVVVKTTGLRDTVNNRKAALKLEEAHAAAIDTGRVHPKDPWPIAPSPQVAKPTFETVAQEMIASARLRLKPTSVSFYEICLNRMRRYPRLAQSPVDAVSAGLVQSYVDWRLTNSEDTKTSLNCEIRTARAILNFAAQRGYAPQAPKISELDAGEGRTRTLTFQEEQRYLLAAGENSRLSDMAVLLLDTGLRPNSEAFPLKWSQVRPGGIVIEKSKTRAGRRLVPISGRVAAMLERRRKERKSSEYVFPGDSGAGHTMTIQKAHFETCDKSGIKRFEVYTFRHSFASRCAEAGIDRYTLASWMGHASPGICDRYYVHVSQPHQARGFEKLEAYLNRGRVEAIPQATERVQ